MFDCSCVHVAHANCVSRWFSRLTASLMRKVSACFLLFKHRFVYCHTRHYLLYTCFFFTRAPVNIAFLIMISESSFLGNELEETAMVRKESMKFRNNIYCLYPIFRKKSFRCCTSFGPSTPLGANPSITPIMPLP